MTEMNLVTWVALGTETSEEYLPNHQPNSDRDDVRGLECPEEKNFFSHESIAGDRIETHMTASIKM